MSSSVIGMRCVIRPTEREAWHVYMWLSLHTGGRVWGRGRISLSSSPLQPTCQCRHMTVGRWANAPTGGWAAEGPAGICRCCDCQWRKAQACADCREGYGVLRGLDMDLEYIKYLCVYNMNIYIYTRTYINSAYIHMSCALWQMDWHAHVYPLTYISWKYVYLFGLILLIVYMLSICIYM